MSGMGGIGSGLGLSKMINVKDLIKKQTEPLKKSLSEKTDAKDLEFEKISSYNKLEGLLKNYQESTKIFRAGFNNALDSKVARYQTNDIGEGGEYLSVYAKDGSTGSSFNVHVERLAKTASLVLQFNDGASNSAFDFDAPSLDGVLDVTVGGKTASISIDNTDTTSNIIESINSELSKQDIKAEAFYIRDKKSDTAHIEIRAKEGETSAVSHSYTSLDPFSSDDITVKSSNPHQTAKVKIDGQDVESDSNKFEDIVTGIDITVKKENTPGKDQSISMITDAEKFLTNLSKTVDAYNSLKAFVALQSERETVDPNDPSKKIRPPLYGSMELSQARDALMQIEVPVGSKSLESVLGIGFKSDPSLSTDQAPAGTEFMTVLDKEKLLNIATENMDQVKDLFSDTWKTTPVAAGTSKMDVTSIDGRLPSYLQNADIDMDVVLDNTGSVSSVEATLPDGAKVTGAYDAISGQVSFGDDTLLKNLTLSFDANGEVNNTVKFSINASNGIADLAFKKSEELLEERVSIDGKLKNTIQVAADKIQKKVIRYSEEAAKIEEQIKSVKDKAKSDMMQINHQDVIGGIMADAIKNMFAQQ